MGFFNKLLGRKKKKDDEETDARAEPESRPEPEPVKKSKAKPKPPAESKARAEADPEPEPAAPTDSMSDDISSSGRGVVREASGTLNTGSSGSLRSMASGSLRAAPSMIQCDSCERDLPVPLASGIVVTCPFCLGRTAYKP